MSETLRPPRDDDAQAVAALMSVHAPEPVDAESVLQLWSDPTVDTQRDVRVGPESYAFVEDLDDGRSWIEVHGRATGDLLDWAEARASLAGTRLFAGAWSSSEATLEALRARGFRLSRHSLRMSIDLDRQTPEAVWPDGMTVRSFVPGDERTFYDVHQETFRDTWEPVANPYEEWAHWLLEGTSFAPDLWLLASAGDEPAGIAIGHPLPGSPDCGHVRILGVRRRWRGLGVGRALLLEAFARFRARGMSKAGLGVDAESPTGANHLYESVGMHVAARFDIYEKTLR